MGPTTSRLAFTAAFTSPAAAQPSPSSAPPLAPSLAPPPGDLQALAALPHDLSPWGMFLAADWVVKGVMIGLIAASLVTWSIWFAKSFEIWRARRRARAALMALSDARSLPEAAERVGFQRGPVALLVRAAAREIHLSAEALDGDGLKERVALRLKRIEANAARRIAVGTGVLATVGSTAPFVGLFGTVWGIMNSFVGISRAQTTNLAVVAPGIAEALLATAIGLVAAIPAVVIYNAFARSIGGYRALLSDASAEVLALLSRDADRGLQRRSGAAE